MSGISQKFPPDQRDQVLFSIDPLMPDHDPIHGDLMLAAVAKRQALLAAYLWDSLGFMDIVDQQGAALQVNVETRVARLADLLQELKNMRSQVEALNGKLDTLLQSIGIKTRESGSSLEDAASSESSPARTIA